MAGGIDHVEVIDAVGRGAEDAEVVDRLLDGDVLVEGDEAAGHEAAGGFPAVLEELGDLIAAVELGEGLGLLFGFELLDDVGNDIVLDFAEDGGEVMDADAANEVAELIVFDEFEELADDIGGEVGEERAAFGFGEVEDELGQVSRVEGGYEGDKLRPLTCMGKRARVFEDFAGSSIFGHCSVLRWGGSGHAELRTRGNVRRGSGRVNRGPLTRREQNDEDA
jgi:hypothetical protein